jgi:hypothetical protein
MFIRTLTIGSIIMLAPVCQARECGTATASAPLHAAVGGGRNCAQTIEVKVCAPAGKKIKSSSIKDLSISPTIEIDRQIRNADESCATAKVSVWARDVIGPPFLQYCREGAYDGVVEVAYCH